MNFMSRKHGKHDKNMVYTQSDFHVVRHILQGGQDLKT